MGRERSAAASRAGKAGEDTPAASRGSAAGPAAGPVVERGAAELSWSVWPARSRPLAAAVLLAGAVILGILIARGTGDRMLGIAGPIFVLVSLSSYLLPTHYRLTPDAVEVRSLGVVRARPWSEMKRFDEDREGVFLSPFEKRSWLDAYRGVRLPLGGNRDQVVAFVEARLAPARRR